VAKAPTLMRNPLLLQAEMRYQDCNSGKFER